MTAVTTDPPVTSVWARRYRVATFGMVALVSLTAYEALAVTTAMPTVVRALDGLPLYALAFAAPLAAGVVGMVAAGGWCDRTGPAAPLTAGVGLFVAGLLVVGLARAMAIFVAGRAVQGFGAGLLSVALYVLVARAYPESLRPRVFSAFAAAWVLPGIVGPSVTGFVVQHIGWRWVFLSVAVVSVPAALLVRPALRGLPPVAPARPSSDTGARSTWARDTWLATGAAVSVGALSVAGYQLAGHQSPGQQWAGVLMIALMVLALAGLGVTVPRLLPPGSMRAARGLPTVIAVRGLASAAFNGAEVFWPLMLSRERGLSPTAAGVTLTVGAVTWYLGSWTAARPRLPLGPATRVSLGTALIAVGIGSAALTATGAVPLVLGAAGWGVAGFGMGVTFPTLSVLTLKLSAPEQQGRNSAALQVNDSLGSAVLLALSGSAFTLLVTTSSTAAYLTCFGAAGAAAVLASVLAPRAG